MRPRVFLSHSKKDKIFIEKLANDLRSCGIDVWYDEWEIPPGESIRKKIFEDGLTSCDVFFVYLTPNSIPSHWVQKELDSAFIHEIDQKNDFLILFVDEDVSRDGLSIDLKALNIPKFNADNYSVPLGKLVSKTWKTFFKKLVNNQEKDSRIRILELEKLNSELQKKLVQIQQSTIVDVNFLTEKLKAKEFEFNEIKKTLLEIFKENRYTLADGCNINGFMHNVYKLFKIENDNDLWGDKKSDLKKKYQIWDYTGELILLGLVEVKTSTEMDQFYFLTKEGIELMREI